MITARDTAKRFQIAMVVQRYGEEVNGGAELHARWLAEHLYPLADVQVLTTCALDFTTWANEYPPGDSELNGVAIRRFPVSNPRDWVTAQKQTGQIIHTPHTLFDELQWVKNQGPYAPGLLETIRRSYGAYDAFIFVTYLYATTFFGLPLVSDKAILVPTAHEEPYLYFPAYRPIFHLPRAIVYNTEPEKQMVNKITRNTAVPGHVVGVGINEPAKANARRFRQKFGLTDPFILYVGRINEAKNIPELLTYFARYRASNETPVNLVLAGKSHLDLPQDPAIVPLGFISEQDKFDAIQAAAVVVMPSLYESLSMIALEAWLMERPMLVNGHCAVLKHQCQQSNGGLYYRSYAEFEATLRYLLAAPAVREGLGKNGRAFVRQTYDWEIIIEKYRHVLQTLDTASG